MSKLIIRTGKADLYAEGMEEHKIIMSRKMMGTGTSIDAMEMREDISYLDADRAWEMARKTMSHRTDAVIDDVIVHNPKMGEMIVRLRPKTSMELMEESCDTGG